MATITGGENDANLKGTTTATATADGDTTRPRLGYTAANLRGWDWNGGDWTASDLRALHGPAWKGNPGRQDPRGGPGYLKRRLPADNDQEKAPFKAEIKRQAEDRVAIWRRDEMAEIVRGIVCVVEDRTNKRRDLIEVEARIRCLNSPSAPCPAHSPSEDERAAGDHIKRLDKDLEELDKDLEELKGKAMDLAMTG